MITFNGLIWRGLMTLGLAALACLGFVGCQRRPDSEPALIDWVEYYAGDEHRHVSYRALIDKRRQIVAVVVCYWPYGLAQEQDFVRATVRRPPDPSASGLWVKNHRIRLAGLQRPAVILVGRVPPGIEKSTGLFPVRRIEAELTQDQMGRLERFAKPFPNENIEETAARFRAMVEDELLGPGLWRYDPEPSD